MFPRSGGKRRWCVGCHHCPTRTGWLRAPAATAGPGYDYNTDGPVTTADYLQLKLHFGNTAPECP